MDFGELGAGILGNTISAFIWLFIIYLFASPRVKLAPKIERLRNQENRFRVPYWNGGWQTLFDIEFQARVAWRAEDSTLLKSHELVVDNASRVTLPRKSETGGGRLIVAPKLDWKNLEVLCGKRGVPFQQDDLELLPKLLRARQGHKEASLIVTVAATHPLTGFRKVAGHIYRSADFYQFDQRKKIRGWL